MKHLETKNGTPISRLGFGAMQFGRTADEQSAREMFETCIGAGINLFDTAFSYTGGASERILGKLVAPMADDILIATKAPNDRPSSSDNLRASYEESRKRLGIDSIDMYYLHRFDSETPLEETFGTLAEMQSEGMIRHIGVSNFAAWQIMKAQAVCAKFDTQIDVCQPMYNLVKRQVEVEILPACEDQGISVCPFSPLGGGLLTGKYADGAAGRLKDDRTYAARYGQPWMHETARGLSALSASLAIPATTLAVAWVARHPAVTSTLISARNASQLQPSLDALDLELSDDLFAEVTRLSPNPASATDRSEET
ncbi:aldo/keto reductase [Falsihalocynthiibacter arcticus]|uniref:Aldo/keto reductase n=1 Tax=Falsihalocynthiibacter arcticus TaxID=1579316 RepID=A0A126V2G6_9RHOB|nr:aldo/keto reductase [Falsihalocynthiibacter arcticus]AML51879.1 aldo/keto reductase [Falsihalocynthiibacter arcticus]